MTASPAIVWFRQDLRLDDNPALNAAANHDGPLICLYVLDDETPGNWTHGGASRWWLHKSLEALGNALKEKKQRLVLRRGSANQVLNSLIEEIGAKALFWNRQYEPWAIVRDKALKGQLGDAGLEVSSFNGTLLREPWEVKTGSGGPYRVYSPFWKSVLAMMPVADALPAPNTLPKPVNGAASDNLSDWNLLPKAPDWAGGLRENWTPGETGARERLADFLDEAIAHYKDGRDTPGKAYTSRLSPHLRFGEISPRRIYHAVRHAQDREDISKSNGDKFLSEIGWREFSYHLLYCNPDLPETSLREEFRKFPWKKDKRALAAWQKGQTGYPIVDAGMRELWHTGWMHNRVRMIVASLLVKHLLIPWQEGEAWFWDTLVDADLANNSASWQWVAGCGADAAPYFRIFNPVLQGEKFDSGGDYVRRWVPEIAGLPNKFIHKPWEAPSNILADAKITLGKTYPHPIVELKGGRDRALAAYQTISAKKTTPK